MLDPARWGEVNRRRRAVGARRPAQAGPTSELGLACTRGTRSATPTITTMPKTAKPSRAGKESKPAKPVATVPERLTKLYRTLHDQIAGDFLVNALKTCDKSASFHPASRRPLTTSCAVLRLAPADTLAGHTKVQLLIALDRHPAALALLGESDKDEPSLERIYCLYKTGRVAEAAAGLAQLDEEVAEERAVRLLEAQVVRPDTLFHLFHCV